MGELLLECKFWTKELFILPKCHIFDFNWI